MASIALYGIRLGRADGLTRPGTCLPSPRYDRVITPSFARP
jgi:hypothetical protein